MSYDCVVCHDPRESTLVECPACEQPFCMVTCGVVFIYERLDVRLLCRECGYLDGWS